MTTALKAINGGSKQRSDVQGQAASRLRKQADADKSIRPHCKAPTENPRVEETAHAPLRGASPSHIESASELEELPMAMDCTTLTLVEAVQGESALLIGESQDCGVEATISHEGACSAAPVTEKWS
jgi:hypothetical protein